MKINHQFPKSISTQSEVSDDAALSQKSELPSNLENQIHKSNSTSNQTVLEINLLGQMVQSALQGTLPQSWDELLKAALEKLEMLQLSDPADVQISPKSSKTQDTRITQTFPKQSSSSASAETASQNLQEAAKKLAEEMKKPPLPPASGGFSGVLVFSAELMKQKRTQQEKAIGLMEQAKSPEEAKQIAAMFGGANFKHEVADPQLKDRLTQTAQKNKMPDHGFTLPSEQLSKNAEKIEKADGDKTVELAKDTELLRNATPEQKVKMIKELGKGFDGHDDKKCIAIDRILSSCKSKEEFDKVLDGAGGKELLKKLNGDEAKKRVNELCGMWGRLDAATQPEVAKKFEGLMTDPSKQAQYSGVRPPTSDETRNVGGNIKSTPPDPAFDSVSEKVKQGISDKAFDPNWDQGSKVELIREQRRRELSGGSKLDYTSVVAQSEKIMNASDDEVRAFKKKKPNEEVSKDDRKDYVKEKMEALRKETGLSEQSINDLVTRKMGNVYSQASGEMAAQGQQIVGELQKQYVEVVRAKGQQSPEAQQLKARIDHLAKNFDHHGKQLAQTSQSYHELFPMPPSFSETIGKIFGFIGDIASSVLKFVPGWGQAFSEIYTAAKSIGQGDIVGGIAGFGGVVSGPGYKEACHFIQRSSRGDVLDAVGNLSKEMGGAIGEEAIKMGKNVAREDWGAVAGQLSQGAAMLTGLGGVAGQAAGVVQKGIDTARAAAKIADGIDKGDGFAVLGGMASAAGAFGNMDGVAGKIAQHISVGINTAKGVGVTIDGAIKGDVGHVLNGLNDTVAGISHLAGPKSPLGGVFGYTQNGLVMLQKFSSGDIAGGVAMGIGLASPHVKEDSLRKMMDTLQTALPSLQALAKGNINALGPLTNHLGYFSNEIQKLTQNPAIQQLIIGMGQSQSLMQAIQKGDIVGLANSLNQKGGLLQTLGGQQFAQTIAQTGKAASQLLESPAMKQVLQMTLTGSNLMQSLASGKTEEAMKIIGGLGSQYLGPDLRNHLQNLAPLAQSMANGGFDAAIKNLAGNSKTRELAHQLGILQPLVSMANGTALLNLNYLSRTLQFITNGVDQSESHAFRLGFNLSQTPLTLPAVQSIQNAASMDGPLGISLRAMTRTLSALSTGDVNRLSEALMGSQTHPSLLKTISERGLSHGIRNLTETAAQALNSPEIQGFDDFQNQLQQMAGLSQRMHDIQNLENETRKLLEHNINDPQSAARTLLNHLS